MCIVARGKHQYWAVCLDAGLMGFAFAPTFREAADIARTMLTLLEIPPQTVTLLPVGPRWFTTGVVTGDA